MSNMNKNRSYEDEDEVRYRKSTPSNKSKSKKKATHKHSYKDCLITYQSYNPYSCRYYDHVTTAKYCTICGKLSSSKLSTTEPREDGGYRLLTNEEIIEKYNYLPLFEVNSDSDYITLTKVEE